MKTYQVMMHPAISIRPDTTVEEIAHLLVDHRISSVPVVDGDQKVIGIVSDHDLFLKEKGIPFSAVKLPKLFEQWVDPGQLKEIYDRVHHYTAADIMTREVLCVDANEDIGQVALLMVQRNLKGLPVIRSGKLVGFVSRLDLIRPLAKAG